ncbi:MAG: gfo/Idh/MocA family oxidoreductase [Phycisphaera sp.]|nr:gfo/Idh/MocA family oxidoreductase [Phycisphaera sp.]
MTIRWGIVGCGDVCEVKSGPGFAKAPGSALVAVMRRDGAKAADFAKRHGVPRWYDDAEALIDDDGVDAVYIATPPGSHVEVAERVAAAGKPAYVEKPMARSAAECRRMIEAFDAAGVPLFVAYYRRRVPRFEKVRELIEGGALGAVKRVSYTYREHPGESYAVQSTLSDADPSLPWRLQVEHSGGGLIMDMGCHALDLLDHWLGPMRDVTGTARRRGGPYVVEDEVEMTWRTDGGVEGAASLSFFSDEPATDLFRIEGDNATLTVPCFAPGAIELRRAGQADTAAPFERFEVAHPPHIQQPLIESIVTELRGEGACPSTGRTALRTNEVMDAVLSDYYGGRDDAFWSRAETWGG